MLRMRSTAAAVTFLLLLGVPQAQPCSWAVGYFHQITVLKGQVVGSNIALFQSVRWLRQSFVRKRAKLTLYIYCWPCALTAMVPVRTLETDNDGKFDFGVLRADHYTLVVDEKAWGHADRFDVEVKDLPHSTESITIDVSPNFPDCTGGHEFIVKMN